MTRCNRVRASMPLLRLKQDFSEKVERCRAGVVVRQCLTQMRLRARLAAAEQARHPVIPPTQRAIRRALLPRRVDREDTLERVLDPSAILQTLQRAERLGERSHICREPEVPVGPRGA